MAKGFASLTAGLVARRDPPAQPAEPPAEFKFEDLPEAPPAPRLVTSDGEHLAPSASLTADLISSGREAYRAEQQRQSEKLASGVSQEAVVEQFPTFLRGPTRTVRDVAGVEAPKSPPGVPGDLTVAKAKLARIAVPEEVDGAPRRRRAVTLRLRPEQHARLLAVRRRLGCSFQVLVVRALEDYLAALEHTGMDPNEAGSGTNASANSTGPLAAATSHSLGQGASVPPNVHLFSLPSGWCIAAWREEQGAGAATPSEVLGIVLKDQGVSDLLDGEEDAASDQAFSTITFGDRGHRLALTIRLDPGMHQRLLAARARLGRTGQDILMRSIDMFLAE